MSGGSAKGRAGAVAYWRVLGTAFDGLVRSCRAESPATPQVAQRVLEVWRANPATRVELEATALLVDGNHVLVGGAEEGRWLLPAFMAGLRRVTLTETGDEEDAVRLGRELAALEPNLAGILAFRDWLWADGAEGFDVVLDTSFAECIDVAFTDEVQQRRMLAAMRVEAAAAIGAGSVYVASRALDVAALREEFQVPLDVFAEQLAGGELAVDAALREEAGRAVEDASFWIDAEVHLALAYPELRSSLPPRRLAKRIVGMLARATDMRFLGLVMALRKRSDDVSRGLLAALEEEPVGQTMARGLKLSEETLREVSALVSGPVSTVTSGLLAGLFERACGDRAAQNFLGQLLMSVGVEKLWPKVDARLFADEAAKLCGKLLLVCRVPPQYVAELVSRVSPKVGVGVLSAAPPAVLWRLRARVSELLRSAPAEDAGELARLVLGRQEVAWVRFLGETLLAAGGKIWDEGTIRQVCAAVVASDQARELLVPLIRSRKADPRARMFGLRALEAQKEVLAEAVVWSPAELVDDPLVKERFREVRRRLKEELA